MKYFILALFLITSSSVIAESTITLILTDDIEIEVQEILPTRAGPTLYYRQAMDSIPAIYPNSEIITSISLGKLSLQESVLYSLVSYIENSDSVFVVSGGTIVVGNRAWRYNVEIPKKLYPQLQNTLIEKVANLAF